MTFNKIFGTTHQALQASNSLLRLSELDHAISALFEDRSIAREALTKLWIDVEENLPISVRAAQNVLIQKCPKPIADIYSAKISKVSTEEGIRKFLLKMQKDVQAVLIPPLKRSFRGNKGPTFLVNYLRGEKHSFVVKWTKRDEIACHIVYNFFATNFLQEEHLNPGSGFFVPAMGCFDFERSLHEMPSRKQIHLSPNMCTKLEQNFQRITEIYTSKVVLREALLFSERIEGENLFDFIVRIYRLLSKEQKEKFFNRLARLAMLDVVTGNLDRLVQVFTHRCEYTLQDLEANLGNVMVVWSKEKENAPFIYAIDNGIEKKLIDSNVHRRKYISFLQKLFSSPNLTQMLAENMVKTFQHALATQVDDVSTCNVVELKKQFQIFSDDLRSLAYPAFLLGFEEMHFHLYTRLIPSWESERGNPLKNYLRSNHPELLIALQERIDTLKNIRRP